MTSKNESKLKLINTAAEAVEATKDKPLSWKIFEGTLLSNLVVLECISPEARLHTVGQLASGSSTFTPSLYRYVCSAKDYLAELELLNKENSKPSTPEELYCDVLEQLGEDCFLPYTYFQVMKNNTTGKYFLNINATSTDATWICSQKEIVDYLHPELSGNIEDLEKAPISKAKLHPHYFKDVSELDEVDVYQVCNIFQVQDHTGCKHHAIKKLLVTGGRGVKNEYQDVKEARDTLNRWLEINEHKKEEGK